MGEPVLLLVYTLQWIHPLRRSLAHKTLVLKHVHRHMYILSKIFGTRFSLDLIYINTITCLQALKICLSYELGLTVYSNYPCYTKEDGVLFQFVQISPCYIHQIL